MFHFYPQVFHFITWHAIYRYLAFPKLNFDGYPHNLLLCVFGKNTEFVKSLHFSSFIVFQLDYA
jgi:hypothetical protein